MIRILYLLLIISPCHIIFSQEQAIKDTLKNGGFQKTERRIRTGDQLLITVYGHDELPKVVRVEQDGTLKYPFMKDVIVDGLTIEQITNILSVRLSQYIGGRAEVIISFAQDETIEVVVLGQVTNPGAHKMPPNNTIQGALTVAGGATNRSDLNNTKLIRINPDTGFREEITVEVENIIVETGDIDRLPSLRNGDIIFVPSIYGAVFVNVLGAVRKPGNYELFPGANLVDVVFLAGGPSDEASLRNIRLIRRIGAAQTEQIVDIEAVLKAKGGQVPFLEPGDIVFVPARKFTIKTFFQYLGYTVSILSAIFLYIQVTK
ncbi:SLBB domain-containing protein [bacterium]|nr:SLBB domain-containing protein [bacterium]